MMKRSVYKFGLILAAAALVGGCNPFKSKPKTPVVGERIAVLLTNDAGRECILTALGAFALGCAVAPLNTRASDEELVAARYTTTSKVESHDVTVEQKVPGGTTAYLVHFVLNGPDGSYVASADSSVFQADGS